SDLYDAIPKTVAPFGARPSLPTAWQATADNTVQRNFAAEPPKPRATQNISVAADAVNAQVRLTEVKLDALRKMAQEASVTANGLSAAIDGMAQVLRDPSSELATANQALIDLQKRNDAIIRECESARGRWKGRALAAEKQAEEALEQLQKQAETPKFVTFMGQHTPGDSVRHLAGEVMKHAADNIELAGIAVALGMVAADVDSSPRGTP
ncbi:hypothetical protein AB0L54_34825, partial [Streptomyces sp. NPDC052196]|uniref:hypothetical protein n=1 Tax=Streptomyces sp. NPDC052196 TaxID=3156691 RepID=UPI00343BCDB0